MSSLNFKLAIRIATELRKPQAQLKTLQGELRPQGVDALYRYEWVTQRIGTTGQWSRWNLPALQVAYVQGPQGDPGRPPLLPAWRLLPAPADPRHVQRDTLHLPDHGPQRARRPGQESGRLVSLQAPRELGAGQAALDRHATGERVMAHAG